MRAEDGGWAVRIEGDGYMEDVTFEGLPDDVADCITLPDTAVGVPVEADFALRNHTDATVRFEWPAAAAGGDGAAVTFVPCVGHLPQKPEGWPSLPCSRQYSRLRTASWRMPLVVKSKAAVFPPVLWHQSKVVCR